MRLILKDKTEYKVLTLNTNIDPSTTRVYYNVSFDTDSFESITSAMADIKEKSTPANLSKVTVVTEGEESKTLTFALSELARLNFSISDTRESLDAMYY